MNSLEDIMNMILSEAHEGPFRPTDCVGPLAPEEYEHPDTWMYQDP